MVNKASRKARCAGSRANHIWPNVEAQSFCLLLVAAQKNLDIDKLTENQKQHKNEIHGGSKNLTGQQKIILFLADRTQSKNSLEKILIDRNGGELNQLIISFLLVKQTEPIDSILTLNIYGCTKKK